MFKILVIEDHLDLQELFLKALQKNSYQTFGAESAEDALKLLDIEYIDLIITDVMLPGISGFELIQALRDSGSNIPVLVITAKSDIVDKQIGFTSGADDYMVKPIDLKEMLLRVSALLRRAKSVSDKKLAFGGTVLEYDIWTLTDENGTQVLPQKEFQLLYKMLSYPGQIFTRQQLLDDIWGGTQEDSHTLDVHISRLREKIKGNPDFEIATIRGLGYRAVRK
ncbi:MAG: response regulator transcription factor [Clostridia bacterium]|nr:response regulator transcription factor [Clostridia bacterium]